MEKLKSLKEKCDSRLEQMVLEEIYREKLPLPNPLNTKQV